MIFAPAVGGGIGIALRHAPLVTTRKPGVDATEQPCTVLGQIGSNEAMLTKRLARTPIALFACAGLAVAAEEPPADPETSKAAAESQPPAEDTVEFKPPPGFRPKKHGDVVLYCRREDVLGSRFKAEKCYDQSGVKELLRDEREKSEMMDRIQNCAVGSCPVG